MAEIETGIVEDTRVWAYSSAGEARLFPNHKAVPKGWSDTPPEEPVVAPADNSAALKAENDQLAKDVASAEAERDAAKDELGEAQARILQLATERDELEAALKAAKKAKAD